MQVLSPGITIISDSGHPSDFTLGFALHLGRCPLSLKNASKMKQMKQPRDYEPAMPSAALEPPSTGWFAGIASQFPWRSSHL